MSYTTLKNEFSWEKVMEGYDWHPLEKFNAGHECCDRWANDPERVAIHYEDYLGNKETWTFKRLRDRSNQMAHALRSMGVQKGDRVAGFLGKDMELIVTILATWKIGAIYVPMFTAFGPDALQYRLKDSGCKVLLTNKEQVEKVTDNDPSLQVILIDGLTNEGLAFYEYLDTFSKEYGVEPTKLDDPAIIQYTSGSTGLPKGAVWSHKFLLGFNPYMKYAISLEEDDIFLCGADPGWAYGMLCIFIPLSFGNTSVIYKGPFQVEDTYRLMESYKVTNFAYAPTAYRMMMAAGSEVIQQYDLKVRKFSSAGEPLNAEVVRFFEKNFGRSIYDHYGATEIGMVICNYNATEMAIKPGSMGFPLVGYNVALIDEGGNLVGEGEAGQIAMDTTDFPFFFLGYWQNDEMTMQKRLGKWLLTGDMATIDSDGYFWFEGRSDDMIVSAGFRIGPFEVESSLIEHPAVMEAAVIGKPDETKGEIVKAYVILHSNYKPTDELAEELKNYVRNHLSKHQYPREIEFTNELPKTPSGKIQRFLLK